MVSCGMKVIRYLLFAFNLLFSLSGIIILAIGATILALNHGIGQLVGSIWWVPAMFIVLGSIIFIISSLGCCGAIRNNNIMMKSFALLLIAILVLEAVVGVVSYVMRTEVEQFLHEKLNASLTSYTTNQQIEDGWNIVQHDFSCCGVNGPQDWESVFHNATLPGVCCPDISVDEQCTMSRPAHSTQGCFETIKDILNSRGIIITSVVSAVAMIQAIGVILACCLARAFRDDYETV